MKLSPDVHQVEKNLQNFDTRYLLRNLDLINASRIQVLLPTFENLIFVPKLIESLQILGVNKLFGYPDLSQLTDEPLSVSQMGQFVEIKVNVGSQPAEINPENVSSIEDKFFVNKPFIFYIYDRINHFPILVGRIVDPNCLNCFVKPKRAILNTGTKVLDALHNPKEVIDVPTDEDDSDKTDDKTVSANKVVQTMEKAHDQPSQLQGYNKIYGSGLLS